jgi:hypothetical protein
VRGKCIRVAVVLLISLMTLQAAQGQDSLADIVFDIESATSTGKGGKHWSIYSFGDAACESKEKGKKIARKKRNKPIEPVRVAAGKSLTLAFWYIEADFGRNTECSYTWTFVPEAGKKYKASLSVAADAKCQARLVVDTGEAVETTTPVHSCVIGFYGRRIPNGEPAEIRYGVKFN